MIYRNRIVESTHSDSVLSKSSTFPLPFGHPLIVFNGDIISSIGDSYLDLGVLSGEAERVNLAACRNDAGDLIEYSPENFSTMTLIASYLIFHPRESYRARTIGYKLGLLVPIFRLCEANKISVTSLLRFPKVWNQLAGEALFRGGEVLGFLEELLHTPFIKLEILSGDQISALRKQLTIKEKNQTPYIPARLLDYQQDRIEQLINDFLDNQENFEKLYNICVKKYQRVHGSKFHSSSLTRKLSHSPFKKTTASAFGAARSGDFASLAQRYGVAHIIEYWVMQDGKLLKDDIYNSAKKFTKFLNGVVYGGAIYIASVTAMRRGEIAKLKANCHQRVTLIDIGASDYLEGECAHIIESSTTKTVDDSNALWSANPFSEKVVRAMSAISSLRIDCAQIYTNFQSSPEQLRNPYLVERTYDPWHLRQSQLLHFPHVRPCIDFENAVTACPNLFEEEEMLITAEDYDIACKLTPSLDRDKYRVGLKWTSHMHQFRRTLITNAAGSGLVSPQSAQYQAKHNYFKMTQYYGNNNHLLNRDPTLRNEILAAMQSNLVDLAIAVQGEEYVSRYGEDHKARALAYLTKADSVALNKLAAKNQIPLRQGIMGICMSKKICNKGGVTMLSYCNSCAELLIGKKNAGLMLQAKIHLERIKSTSDTDSLLFTSADEQITCINENLKLIQTKDIN